MHAWLSAFEGESVSVIVTFKYRRKFHFIDLATMNVDDFISKQTLIENFFSISLYLSIRINGSPFSLSLPFLGKK